MTYPFKLKTDRCNRMDEEKGMSRFLSMGNYEKKRYSFIASFFKEVKGRFLDIGCHNGALSKYLHSELEYFGIDGIDNEFKNYVKADLNAKRLPFTDNMFDAINCSAVLEHLFYPHDILKEMKRLLKDGGTVLVSLPNDKSLNALFSQRYVRKSIRPAERSFLGEFRSEIPYYCIFMASISAHGRSDTNGT